MRFFKTADTTKLIRQIAAEAVNITYNETFFDIDGNLLEKKIPNHNTYTIDTVDYIIIPNYGIIHILGESTALFNAVVADIEAKFHEMYRMAATKFGMPSIPIAGNGTTQYIGITQPVNVNSTTGFVKFVTNTHVDSIATGIHFIWNISSDGMPVSHYTKDTQKALYSLSSIVVETHDQINLPDGFRNPDYPSYRDYQRYTSGRLKVEPMDFHPNYGIHRELTKYFPDVARSKKNPIFSKCSRTIRLVDWNWFVPYSISLDSILTWSEQIKMGLLDTEPCEELTYKCITTNTPIYDDCYVFDIIERTIEETIEDSDLHKYPDAVVVNPEGLDAKAVETKTMDTKAAETKAMDEELDASDEESDTRRRRKVKRTQKINPKKVEKPNPKKTAKEKPKVVPKVIPRIIKRGNREPTKMIRIRYQKKYDTPKCVLISPYYMHLFGLIDAVDEFEKQTNTKVLVYRTRSPRSVYDTINLSNADQLTKQILIQLYKGAFFKGYQKVHTTDSKIVLSYGSYGSAFRSANLFNPDPHIIGHLLHEVKE